MSDTLQNQQPDDYFTGEQQQRLSELMERWRVARDSGTELPADKQAELQTLIKAELQGAIKRAEALQQKRTEDIG